MGDEGEDVEVTFRMIPTVVSALDDIAMIEGITTTDALNRAVQIYQHLLMEKQIGKRVALIQDQVRCRIFWVRRIESFDWK